MSVASYADHFRRCLEECDVATMRKLWRYVAPNMPQPVSDFEVLTTIHYARTLANSITLNQRAWSHRWLLDHGFTSPLPDELKPKAERIYPKVVTGVGISVNMRARHLRPIGDAIRDAMSDAVMDAYAHHQTEPGFVKARMFEARNKVLKG